MFTSNLFDIYVFSTFCKINLIFVISFILDDDTLLLNLMTKLGLVIDGTKLIIKVIFVIFGHEGLIVIWTQNEFFIRRFLGILVFKSADGTCLTLGFFKLSGDYVGSSLSLGNVVLRSFILNECKMFECFFSNI